MPFLSFNFFMVFVTSAQPSAVPNRPEDYGCKPDGIALCTNAIKQAIASCPASGTCVVEFSGPGVYLTQAFNLTSNLELRIGSEATILGTSEDRYNLNAAGAPQIQFLSCTHKCTP